MMIKMGPGNELSDIELNNLIHSLRRAETWMQGGKIEIKDH